MAKPKCVPLKVTCTLLDGTFACADGIVMLDAILYHAWYAKHMPDVLTGERDTSARPPQVGLPLRQEPGNTWAASAGVYTQTSVKPTYVNKRPDFFNPDETDMLDLDKGIISDSVGPYRAWRVPLMIRTVRGPITFYAVGHADEVLELLGYIGGIGKKNAAGYGRVREWSVEEISDDWHMMKDGVLMRPVPVGASDTVLSQRVQTYGYRPPYWKPCNQQLCYVPMIGGAA